MSHSIEETTIAVRIENFLSENDPAYGYTQEQPGWKNKEQAINSIVVMLQEQQTEWMEEAFNGLLRERPELGAQIGELQNLVEAAVNDRMAKETMPQPELTCLKDKLAEAQHRCAEAPQREPQTEKRVDIDR